MKISVSASGQNLVAPAMPGKRIRVTSYLIIAAGVVGVKWQSNTTDLSGIIPLVAQAGIAAGPTPPSSNADRVGWLETAIGENLYLTLDAATLVAGHLTFDYV